MRTKRNLLVESLERREVFTAIPGVEVYDTPMGTGAEEGSGQLMEQPTSTNHGVQEHCQSCIHDGTSETVQSVELLNASIAGVNAPRDPASGRFNIGMPPSLSENVGTSTVQSNNVSVEECDGLMAMVASGEVSFDQDRFHSLNDRGTIYI